MLFMNDNNEQSKKETIDVESNIASANKNIGSTLFRWFFLIYL